MIDVLDVSVKVPAHRLGQFYERHGLWLAEVQASDAPADAGPQPWADNEDSLAPAGEVWAKLSAPAKALFSLWIDHPGAAISAQEIAHDLGIPNGKNGVAGLLAWPGRYCAAVNRELPWRWEPGSENSGAYYWMESEVAELFRKVRG
jgi:hypothetical protein